MSDMGRCKDCRLWAQREPTETMGLCRLGVAQDVGSSFHTDKDFGCVLFQTKPAAPKTVLHIGDRVVVKDGIVSWFAKVALDGRGGIVFTYDRE